MVKVNVTTLNSDFEKKRYHWNVCKAHTARIKFDNNQCMQSDASYM